MKHVFGPDKPDYVTEVWPSQMTIFCWLDYLFTVPRAVSVITTCKENGTPNACPDAWGTLIGGGTEYSSLIAIYHHYHTYENILREKEWCINYPDNSLEHQWDQTIRVNASENDEINDAGFSMEPCDTIKAPRIAECLINLECRLEWDRPLYEGSNIHLFCGRISALAIDESIINRSTEERLQAMNLSYHVQGQLNPQTGEWLNTSKYLNILKHDIH